MGDVSLYEMCIENHLSETLSQMRPVYRAIRNEIVNKYHLRKGEFTKVYAFTRGRIH